MDTYDRDLTLMQQKIDILRHELDQTDEIHADELNKLFKEVAILSSENAELKKKLRLKECH